MWPTIGNIVVVNICDIKENSQDAINLFLFFYNLLLKTDA